MSLHTIDLADLATITGGAASPERRAAGTSHLANTSWTTTGFGGLADMTMPACFLDTCDFNKAGELRFKGRSGQPDGGLVNLPPAPSLR